ncbi:MAG: pyrroline-5-carboxylate reductase [Candidatus Sumerlaeota bacterium]
MSKRSIESLGLIGAGNMGSALIRGACDSLLVEPKNVWIYDPDTEKTAALARDPGVRVASSGVQVLANAGTILLAVKPQILVDVLKELGPAEQKDQVFISVAAGIPTALIEKHLGERAIVIRAMPNTPAMLGKGATAVAGGTRATMHNMANAQVLFGAVGLAVSVEEEQMNAVTGLSGSGPAYVFRMIEALTQAGIAAGLGRQVADNLARQTVLGAATMASDLESDPAELRRRVTSPGGTTEAGLKVLDEAGFMELIERVVLRARDRGQELGKALED